MLWTYFSNFFCTSGSISDWKKFSMSCCRFNCAFVSISCLILNFDIVRASGGILSNFCMNFLHFSIASSLSVAISSTKPTCNVILILLNVYINMIHNKTFIFLSFFCVFPKLLGTYQVLPNNKFTAYDKISDQY